MKTRREFIRQLAFGTADAVADAGSGPLVCVFLRGGADTLNMFVPYADDNYYRLRPSIGIPSPSTTNGVQQASIKLNDFYALHPKLGALAPVFQSGRMAIVQAVGSDNSSGSHFEAQDQMEHGESQGHTLNGGWLGRHLAGRAGKQASPLTAVAISSTIPESLRGAPAMTAMNSIDEVQMQLPAADAQVMAAALDTLYSAELDVVGAAGQDTLRLLKRIETLRSSSYKPRVPYPKTDFAQGLLQIARLIKADLGLEAACIDSGGWDTHFVQGNIAGLQADRMQELAEALAAFDSDTRGSGATILVMTEFGRRIYENGSLGTDHGRGFAMTLIGDRVHGGIFGTWPGLEDNGDFTLGPSGLAIRNDYRAVIAEVLAQVAPQSQLDRVFPGVTPTNLGAVSRA